jgi:hypothetical protein
MIEKINLEEYMNDLQEFWDKIDEVTNKWDPELQLEEEVINHLQSIFPDEYEKAKKEMIENDGLDEDDQPTISAIGGEVSDQEKFFEEYEGFYANKPGWG